MADNDSQQPDGEGGDAAAAQPTSETTNTEAAATTAPSTGADIKTLTSALTDANLNVQKWSKLFQTECGVTEYQQLEYLDNAAFQKLQSHASGNMWEKNALRKLLGIGEKYDPNHASKVESAKQQAEEARAFLKEIQETTKGERDRTDAVVNEKMKLLRAAMQISDNDWINKGNDHTIDSVTEKLIGQLGNGEKLETDRKKLSPTELLEKASGGSALRGMLVTNNPEDCIDTRRTVLKAPDIVELKSPISSQKDHLVEFSSKKQSDNFSRSLETMGHSMATSVKGGKGLFQAEAGGSESHQEETTEEQKKHGTLTYLSRLMYFYVPTAVCELQEFGLKLCEDALAMLRELETIVEFSDSEDMIQRKCKDFLRTYGSHVNVGHIEFGGIYQWKSTYYGKTKSEKTQIQSLVQDALSAHVSASYGIPGVGPSIGGSFSGGKETGEGKAKGSYEQSDMSNTTLKTDKKGGPQEVSDPVRWKTGIMKYNETWAVIDRGHREEERIAIWKVMERNHTGEFSDVTKLSNKLQEVWKSMGGPEPTDDCGRILNIKRTMDEMLKEIHEWKDDASLASNAAGYLERMSEKVETCSSVTGVFLVRTLKDHTLSKFLRRFMELKDEYSQADLALVKFYLQKLLDAAGTHEFPLKDIISLWVQF